MSKIINAIGRVGLFVSGLVLGATIVLSDPLEMSTLVILGTIALLSNLVFGAMATHWE